jgi:NAD(P)-dependent dehydrogenase (short-subunit alcohol dehydrogenase family)
MITSLKGANVVVLGGSHGLGRVVVTAAHREGAHVLAVARQLEPLVKLSGQLPGIKTLAMRPAKTRQ